MLHLVQILIDVLAVLGGLFALACIAVLVALLKGSAIIARDFPGSD